MQAGGEAWLKVPGSYQTRGTRRAQRAAEEEAAQEQQTQEERADNEGETALSDPGGLPLGDEASTVVRSRRSSVASEGVSIAEAKGTEHPLGFPETKRTAPPSAREATPPSSPASATPGIEHLDRTEIARTLLPRFNKLWKYGIVSKEDLLSELIRRIVEQNQDPEAAEWAIHRTYNHQLDIARQPELKAQQKEASDREYAAILSHLEVKQQRNREIKEKQERLNSILQEVLQLQALLLSNDEADQEAPPPLDITEEDPQQHEEPVEEESSNRKQKARSASSASSSGSSSSGSSSSGSSSSSNTNNSSSGSSSSGSSSSSSRSSSSSEDKTRSNPSVTSRPLAEEIEQPRLPQARPPSTERGFPYILHLNSDLAKYTASSEREIALNYFDLLARAFDIRAVRRAILAEYQRIYTPQLLGQYRTATPHQRLQIERRVDEQVQNFYHRELFLGDDFAYHLPTNHPLRISARGLPRLLALRSQLEDLDRRILRGDLTHIRGRFLIRQVHSVTDFYERLEAPSAPRGLYSRLLSILRQSFRTFVFLDPVNQSRTIDISREFRALVIRIREAFEQNNTGLIIDALRLTAYNLNDNLEDRIENFVRFIGRPEFAGITWNFSKRKFCIRFHFPVPHSDRLHITADGHLQIIINPIIVRDTSWTFHHFQGAQEELRAHLRITVQLPPRDSRASPQPPKDRVRHEPIIQDVVARRNQVPPPNIQQPVAQQQQDLQPLRLEDISSRHRQPSRRRKPTQREDTRRPRQSEDRRDRQRSYHRNDRRSRDRSQRSEYSRHHRRSEEYRDRDRSSHRYYRQSPLRESHHPDRRSYRRDDRRGDSREPYRRRHNSRSRSREDRDYYTPSSCRDDYRRERRSRSR